MSPETRARITAEITAADAAVDKVLGLLRPLKFSQHVRVLSRVLAELPGGGVLITAVAETLQQAVAEAMREKKRD